MELTMNRKLIAILLASIIALQMGCADSIRRLKLEVVRSNDLVLTMKRGECYGTCPVYEVSLDDAGNVTFNGIKHTKMIGKATGKVSSGDIDQLVTALNAASFLKLNQNYDQKTCPDFNTDMSTVVIELKLNGLLKTVNHNLGCSTKSDHKPYPPGLRELEDKIDQAARTAQWIK